MLTFPYRKCELGTAPLRQCSSCCLLLVVQVFLAKLRNDAKYYAVKVLQKKVILNRKEVTLQQNENPLFRRQGSSTNWLCFSIQQKHIMAERNVLLKNVKHPFLVGLHYSFQTTDKLYFVLDFINGGEVSSFSFVNRNQALRQYRLIIMVIKGISYYFC